MKLLLIAGSVGAVILLFGGVWLIAAPRHTTEITFYSGSNVRRISSNARAFSHSEYLIETLFSNVSTGLYEPLSKHDLTSSGTAVAIVYEHAITLRLRNPLFQDAPVTVDRILIGLSGPRRGLILSGRGSYNSAPYITADTATITSLARFLNDE